MGETTHISWADHTWNPWEGCTKVSPGCLNCYAEARNQRFHAGENWGKGAPRRRTGQHNWNEPFRWARAAVGKPHRPRVFCSSLADWLDPEVPYEWLAGALHVIKNCPELDWMMLTKRPELFFNRMGLATGWHVKNGDADTARWIMDWVYEKKAPKHVWIGTSVEDQTRADERVPALMNIPAVVRFLSMEPLLGQVDLWGAGYKNPSGGLTGAITSWGNGINWVIVGGESGLDARPMHPQWASRIKNDCVGACIPFHFKQWGEWAPIDQPWKQDSPKQCGENERWMNLEGGHGFHGKEVWRMRKVGKIKAGFELDGVAYQEFPKSHV